MPDVVLLILSPDIKREARDWITTLASRSIKPLDEHSRNFMMHYLTSKKKMKTSIRLMQVVQEKDESLQYYLTRFNRVTVGIKDLHISTVILVIK